MRKLFLAGLSVAPLIGGAVVAAGLPGPVTAASAAAPAPADRTTTTLLTGPGRERIGYLTAKADGKVFVYPQDAVSLVRAGRLDERRFDVAGLVALGCWMSSTTCRSTSTTRHRSARNSPARSGCVSSPVCTRPGVRVAAHHRDRRRGQQGHRDA